MASNFLEIFPIIISDTYCAEHQTFDKKLFELNRTQHSVLSEKKSDYLNTEHQQSEINAISIRYGFAEQGRLFKNCSIKIEIKIGPKGLSKSFQKCLDTCRMSDKESGMQYAALIAIIAEFRRIRWIYVHNGFFLLRQDQLTFH